MSQTVIDKNIEAADGAVRINGSCLVKGNIIRGNLSATADIIIQGAVIDSIVMTSGGNVNIQQGIEGEATRIESFGDIRADYCHGGDIKSRNGSVYFKSRVTNAKVAARNLVHVTQGTGVIEKATVQAGIEIITNQLGNENNDSTYAVLSNERQQEMFELMLVYEQKLRDKKKRLEQLSKVIKIIRLLGDNVVKLPQHKKQELASQVQEYNTVKNEIDQTIEEKQKVMKKNQEMKLYTRAIIVNQRVFPKVQISIDKLNHQVNRNFEKVIFYKTGIIIMGDLDKYKLRQR